MTFTDAAAEVLRLVGRPLHYKEITDIAIEKNLLSHVGKSPEVTMGARLAATLKKDSAENPLVRVKPGVFALREWDDKTIKAGLEPRKGAGKKGQQKDSGHDGEEPQAATPADSEAATEAAPAVNGHTGRGRHQMTLPTAAAHDDDDEVLIGGDEEAAHATAHAVAAGADADDIEVDTDDEPVTEEAPPARVPAPAPSARPVPAPAAAFARAPRNGEEARAEEIDAEPPGPDDVMRAEAAAGAAEMFDEEDDDDQPILGGTDDRAPQQGGEANDGRRRRRRRRRGRTNGEAPAPAAGTGGLPSYTATPAFDGPRPDSRPDNRPDSRGDRRDFDRRDRDASASFDGRPGRDGGYPQAPAQPTNRDGGYAQAQGRDGDAVFRPQVIELTGGEGHALDDLAGRELSDAVAVILATFDRNAGAVSLRSIAETAQRRGRLAGDAQLVQSQVAAAVRADNARRITAGQRPRFRLAGGRVALTDWLLSGDLARLEQEALAAVERYRDAARRAFARKLGELPGHAFVEICVLALEKIGVSQLRALRRAGVPGGESHFSGVLRSAASDELKLALVIRRDGREVGRERVADLRGSLHHYGPAAAGWIFTAGQMLSGAREEAAVPGTAPIALFDGLSVARLCEDNDVAVIRARLPIAIPDVDLLEALRAS
jgi:hypothetical protein